ncbi:MAG: DUF2092 domain-containing protein [bacterium]|nr:DUF2092 domain-containing protein [bacterium]
MYARKRTASRFALPVLAAAGLALSVGMAPVSAVHAQETKVMEDAVTIGARLTRDGRVAVYGIFFESDKADIAAESDPVIGEIAKLLAETPELEIAIVGHTDATGSHDHNLKLSKMRADAVVAALTTRHGIDQGRLYPAGAGFLQPIAPNDTEDGKALNRRVELIQMRTIVGDTTPDPVVENAKLMLKGMSDYLASQNAISFGYDSSFEVITEEEQRLSLASSGTVTLNRPDKLRAARSGGFADVEMIFDGQTLTLFGKTVNLFTQIQVPGSIDNLTDVLRKEFDRPLPASDLLSADVYDHLIANVINVKDLGSGVVNGVECDYLAFRTDTVDWQIWIAHGDRPYPCKYVITTKDVDKQPEYTIQIRDWKTGDEVAPDDFAFVNSTDATAIEPADLSAEMSEFPANFMMGAN